jgi:acetylornithine deacetylase
MSRNSLDIIGRLIGFDTTSRNSNQALIDWIRDYLGGFGIPATLVPQPSGAKANLYATVGPADRPGVMLAGHTDCVPVDGQDWTSDPFQMIERDRRLYGRGSADMKSFIAVALALVPEYLTSPLTKPLHLAFTYDEETGCFGAERLVEALAKLPVRPEMCIIGEPTEMQVVLAHKGKRNIRCRVRGKECHSSLTSKGVNAIEVAAELIAFLNRLGQERRDKGPQDPGFEPPYTTVHTGTIQGGTALNIVPKDCAFEFEFRCLPGDNAQALLTRLEKFAEATLLPAMRSIDPSCRIEFEIDADVPPMATADEAEVVTLAKGLAGSNRTAKVSFCTEGGHYSRIGIPTVICGPGSVEQAHKPDEFITLDQIALCEDFLRRLLARLRG